MRQKCTIEGCSQQVHGRGLCGKHWMRWHRNGDPLIVRHVYHVGTPVERFLQKLVKTGPNECWGWTARTFRGYGMINVPRPVLAHRFSWEVHNGPIPAGLHVLHRCDNPPCCNPAHLFLGTNADNIADKVSKGRQGRGERAGGAKLTEKDVRAIRVAAGTQKSIAARFGISTEQVGKIIRYQRWKHIT